MLNGNLFSYEEMNVSGNYFSPAELIQIDVEKNIHEIEGVSRDEIKNIVVVGAWRGNEVASFVQYPNAHVFCYEPNKENFSYLYARWGNNDQVSCFNLACAATDGEMVLHEASLTGNDSLLGIKEDSKSGLTQIREYIVKTIALDGVDQFKEKNIDLIWADVQGYELEVLKGATNLLTRTKALFLEVYRENLDYKGAATYAEVVSFLNEKGFYLAAEGLDNNFGGNALFLRKDIVTKAYTESRFLERIINTTKEVSFKKFLVGFWLVKKILNYMPVTLKIVVRKFLSRFN